MAIQFHLFPLIYPEVRELTRWARVVLARLLRQLSPYRGRKMTEQDELEQLIRQSCCFITAVCSINGSGWHTIGVVRLAVDLTEDKVRHGELHDEIVHERYRGTGIGKALVKEAIRRARLLHVADLRLKVKPHRKDAIVLYERLGFELVSVDPSGVRHYRLDLLPTPTKEMVHDHA